MVDVTGQVAVQDDVLPIIQIDNNQAPMNSIPSVANNFDTQYAVPNPIAQEMLVQSIPVVDGQQAIDPNNIPLAAPLIAESIITEVAVEPTPVQIQNDNQASAAWDQIAQINIPPESPLELGAIGGMQSTDLNQTQEKVEGLMLGNNMDVAKQISSTGAEVVIEEAKIDRPVNPLADLYGNLERMAKNSQLVLEQEMQASRGNQSYDQMKDEALGWQITGRVTNVLMIISWVLATVSLFFPVIFKNIKSEKGLSVDFGLFIVTIMVLLTCTILSFWVHSHKIVKTVTWCVFVFFVFIFVLISLKSGGVIGGDIPVMNVFLNRFSL